MDESNHEMLHMLTHQMATDLTPMMENNTNQVVRHNNQNYQVLARHMGRIVDILSASKDPCYDLQWLKTEEPCCQAKMRNKETPCYNLLLGREWIHVVEEVPSTLPQKMFLWNKYGDLEVVPANGSPFEALQATFMNFDKVWEQVGPFNIDACNALTKHKVP